VALFLMAQMLLFRQRREYKTLPETAHEHSSYEKPLSGGESLQIYHFFLFD
jgi:hypothetical protein